MVCLSRKLIFSFQVSFLMKDCSGSMVPTAWCVNCWNHSNNVWWNRSMCIPVTWLKHTFDVGSPNTVLEMDHSQRIDHAGIWPIRSWKVDVHSSPSHVFQRSILDSFELFSGQSHHDWLLRSNHHTECSPLIPTPSKQQHLDEERVYMRGREREADWEFRDLVLLGVAPSVHCSPMRSVCRSDGRPKNCRISHILSTNDLPKCVIHSML